MEFKHKGCKGTIIINVSDMVIIKAPSIQFIGETITVDAVEIEALNDKSIHPQFRCIKCKEVVEPENVEVYCQHCSSYCDMNTFEVIPDFTFGCHNCISLLKSDEETDNSRINRVRDWLHIPKSIKPKKLSVLFQKEFVI